VPIAVIDWDTAAPGPRAWDLGMVAWRWVPLWRDEKCRAHGLPVGVGEKARRFRLLLDAYEIEPDMGIVRAGVERLSQFLGQQKQAAADGTEWEVELERRGLLDETRLEIQWMEENARAIAAP